MAVPLALGDVGERCCEPLDVLEIRHPGRLANAAHVREPWSGLHGLEREARLADSPGRPGLEPVATHSTRPHLPRAALVPMSGH